MSQAEPKALTVRAKRLNTRALIVLVVVAIVLPALLLAIRGIQTRRSQPHLLSEAKKQLEAGKPELAISYLKSFVDANPQDSAALNDALNLRAKILGDTARDDAGTEAAIRAYNQLLSRDSERPEGQDIRRKLIDLNLQARPTKARAAEALARELIKRGADDADAHRLLGKSLAVLGMSGGPNAGQYLDEARIEFETAERMAPGDVETAQRLAFLYRDRFNKPLLALQVLDKVLESSKGSPEKLAAAHLARCRFFLAVSDRNRAAAEVQAAIKAVPGDLESRLVLAEMAAQAGDARAAKNHLDSIDAKSKGDLRIKLVNGLIQLTEQKHDEAIQSWRTGLLQIGGNDEQLTWRLAQVLLQLNRVAEAEPLIEQYRRLIGKSEPTPEYRYLRALVAIKSNHAADAITILETIRTTIEPSLAAQLNFTLGQAYETTRDTTKALNAYRKAADLSTKWNGPWIAVARLLEHDKPVEAIEAVKQGLSAIPNDPNLLAALGRLIWKRQISLPVDKRNWSELEQVLELGKRVAPNSAELALVQADYLNATGKSDDALALLQAGTKQNPTSVGLWLAHINILSRRGLTVEAIQTADRATAAAGEQAVFRTTKAYLLMTLSRPKQARATLVEGLERVPADQQPALWKALGEFYLNQGDRTNGRKAFVQWARLNPESPEPRMLLLDLALAAGDDAAIKAEVDGLKNIGGGDSVFWKLARVQELLRPRPKTDQTAEAETERLNEAERLIKLIKEEAPRVSLGSLLEARLMERRGKADEAAKAYEAALKLGAGQVALRPLVVLLTQNKKFAELERLKREAVLPVEMEKLSAEISLKMGDTQHAQQLIDRLVQGDPMSLDLRTWQSKVLKSMGKPQEAERAIRFMLDQRPDEPGPWIQLLTFQVGQGQTTAAADTVEQIRARVKTDLPELLWGMCYRISGQFSRADECFSAALKKWPDETRVHLAAIAFYEASGRLPKAEASLRHLLARDPSMAFAVRKLALMLSARTNDKAAWQEAIKLIGPEGSGADAPEDRLTRAIVYGRGSRPSDRVEAIRILQSLIVDSPEATAAHFELAKLYLRDGQKVKALEHAARAASSDDAGPDPILTYAGLLLESKQLDAAEAQRDRLRAMAPDSLPTIELEARILHARGKTTEAGALLEKAFNDRSKSLEAVVTGQGILQILTELKLPDVAERVGKRLATVAPEGACIWANVLASQGRKDEAAKMLEQAAQAGDPRNASRVALQLAAARDADARWIVQADQFLGLALKGDPASAELLQAQAYVRHLQSRHKEEIELYKQVLAKNPNDYLFLNNMAWTLSENMNDPEEGLKRIDEATAKLGFDPHIADTRGVILTRLKRYPEAIKELEAAVAVLPTGPIFYHLARACKQAGRQGDYEKYRDLAKQSGLTAADLQPNERAEMEAMMKP